MDGYSIQGHVPKTGSEVEPRFILVCTMKFQRCMGRGKHLRIDLVNMSDLKLWRGPLVGAEGALHLNRLCRSLTIELNC